MRMIERKMLDAILSNKDWRTDNTEVRTVSFTHSAEQIQRASVYLHNNKIAEVTPNSITINNCGWATPTTKSRLNALLRGLRVGAGIYQRNRQWYLSTDNGDIPMDKGTEYVLTR